MKQRERGEREERGERGKRGKRGKIFTLMIAVTMAVTLCLTSCLTSCQRLSAESFSICFIDVGQGDSALVECDRHYMLIDGGDITAGSKVYSVLEEKKIQRLDILAISHLHGDHIGGLPKALTYASRIDRTIANTDEGNSESFRKLEHELGINGTKITVPRVGTKYKLGRAEVEVVENSAEEDNDSLVLLVTYGKTRFLFTGDIGEEEQAKIAKKYESDSKNTFKINLMKMPHHGAYNSSLQHFVRTFMPDYIIISVGRDNGYGHPDPKTLDMLSSKSYKPKVYRTDKDGNITVKSDGKKLTIKSSR